MQYIHCTFGYAHLDVRLENICFSTASPHHAILIDLDRCSPVTKPAYFQERYYPSSAMYKSCDKERKVDQLDWLQFSLMVKFAQDQSITDYHSIIGNKECHFSEEGYVIYNQPQVQYINHTHQFTLRGVFCN